jgi:hypothetical protein
MTAICDFTQGPPGIPGNGAVSLLDNPASQIVFKGFTTQRGRQYELGTVQAGELKLNIDDPQEWLNPVNPGSPLNSGANQLLPYRQVQIGTWWNRLTKDVSGNLLNSTNLVPGSVNTYDPSFEGGGLGGFFGFIGAPVITNSTVQAFQGTRSLSCVFTGATDTPTVALFVPPYQLQTLSLYVFVPASHTVTAKWFNFNTAGVGALIGQATSSLTGTWQRLVITGTPATPTNVLELTCSAAYPATVYVDALQLQLGGAATGFVSTGPTYAEVFTGYIERYPQQWADQGMRGVKPLEAVDALSPLSRTIIAQSYASTVLADGPAVFVPYNDDSFPQTVQQPTGGAPYTGYQAIGSQSASVSFGGDSFLDGSKAVTLSQQNADPLTSNDNTQTTRLGTRYGSLLMDPTGFTYEVWVRWTAGQTWFGAGSLGTNESTTDPNLHDGPPRHFAVRTASNQMAFTYGDANNVGQVNVAPLSGVKTFADEFWHHLVFSGTGSNSWRGGKDNVLRTGTYDNPPPVAMKIDNLYHYVNTFYGDIISVASFANVALYNFALSPAQIAAHYQRGIGYFGEKSGTRALRLLTAYWSTAVVTDTGVTSMAADFSYNGRAMLDVLQEVADTESGLVWVDTAGFVHQDSRETRYTAATSTTPQFVFGENAVGGELPYSDLKYDYDPTYVYSQANFTAGGSGATMPPVINATTQTAVGQRVLSKTLQMAVDWDVQQAAKFYVQRYAKPAGAPGTGVPPRIAGMTIDPSSNPDLWTAALTLDVGYRVTVKRRTAAGVTISGDYYIEQVSHSNNGAKWTVTYQLSPVFVSQAWVLGDAVKGVLGTTTVCVY